MKNPSDAGRFDADVSSEPQSERVAKRLPDPRSERSDPSSEQYVLRVMCPDGPGIVATVAGLIAACGGNITEAHQHSEPAPVAPESGLALSGPPAPTTDMFFQRIVLRFAETGGGHTAPSGDAFPVTTLSGPGKASGGNASAPAADRAAIDRTAVAHESTDRQALNAATSSTQTPKEATPNMLPLIASTLQARGPIGQGPAALDTALRALPDFMHMKVSLMPAHRRSRVAIFVSSYDHCLQDLLWRHQSGELLGDIRCIVSNHERCRSLAAQFGIPFEYTPIDASNQQAQEARQMELLAAHGIELVVLARYMRVLGSAFVAAFPDQIINIHHSFLPAFAGGRPYHQAFSRGVKLIGATAHYATEALDEGPIIEQDVARCSHRDSVQELTQRGRDLEKVVLARAVRAHLAQRVMVCGRRTVVFS